MNYENDPLAFFENLGLRPEQAFSCLTSFNDLNDLKDEYGIPSILLLDHALQTGHLSDHTLVAHHLWEACQTGDLLMCCVALEYVNPNIKNDDGNTPLHLAINLPATALALLEKGANPNALNAELKRPIDLCNEVGNTEVAILLLASGSRP